jgi:hypothetical protein
MQNALPSFSHSLAGAAARRTRRAASARRPRACADEADALSRAHPELSAERLRSAALERELVGQRAAFARLQADAEDLGQRLLDALAAAERSKREAATLRQQLDAPRPGGAGDGGAEALRAAGEELARLRAERDDARARVAALAQSAVTAWEAAHQERERALSADAALREAQQLAQAALLPTPLPQLPTAPGPRAEPVPPRADPVVRLAEGPSEEALQRLRRRNMQPRELLLIDEA